MLITKQDFFFDVLNASSTRRDAKQYLDRFKPAKKTTTTTADPVQLAAQHRQDRLTKTGVNLGQLYKPTRAAASSPTFSSIDHHVDVQRGFGEMHVALVSIRAPHLISDKVLDGIALTLSQLVRLDMCIVLAIDCDQEVQANPDKPFKDIYEKHGERIVAAIERHNNAGSRYVDSAMAVGQPDRLSTSSVHIQGGVSVEIPALIFHPLRRGAIPVIPAIARTSDFRSSLVPLKAVMLALTRIMSDVALRAQAEADIDASLDRIIMLEPLGGVPSEQREDKAHVFINLEQEYDDIVAELEARPASEHQLRNIDILRSCLTLLPPSTSALLISPKDAACHSRSTDSSDSIGITTRRQKNPLIHNLLTNKPLISSSLPIARLPPSGPLFAETQAPTRSTLLKRGMPVTIVPDPRHHPWTPPKPGESTISLENHPDINLPRLVALIEDSFRRPLDVRHYLKRIENRIAGVIIAGEYEGGAILTWEQPPHLSSSSSSSSYDPHRLVPYLDKFAVLQRSQGSSGVADIVFQSMVRSCFPSGVCWRSRKTNPVNKWYFERSTGSWDLAGTQWTMFWTGEGVVEREERWRDYVGVCAGIGPSWLDDHKPPD